MSRTDRERPASPWPFFAIVSIVSLVSMRCAPVAPRSARVPVPIERIAEANRVGLQADVALARQDHYAALVKYLDATRINPNNERCHNGLGMAYSQLGFQAEAIAAFERAIALAPKFAAPYNNLGIAFLLQGKKKAAERCFRKAISLDSSMPTFRMNLGVLYLSLKRHGDALREFRKALEIDPDLFARSDRLPIDVPLDSPEKHYQLARFFASIGDAKQAVEMLSLALQRGFSKLESIRNDPEFDPIRNSPAFQSWLHTAELLASR